MIKKLNGWQRIWIVLTFLWFVVIIFLVIDDFPQKSYMQYRGGYNPENVYYLDDELFKEEKLEFLNLINDKEKEISGNFDVESIWGRIDKEHFSKLSKKQKFFKIFIAPKLPDGVHYNAALTGFNREFPNGSDQQKIEDLKKEDKEKIQNEQIQLRKHMINHILAGFAYWIIPLIGLYLFVAISSKTVKWIIAGFRKE